MRPIWRQPRAISGNLGQPRAISGNLGCDLGSSLGPNLALNLALNLGESRPSPPRRGVRCLRGGDRGRAHQGGGAQRARRACRTVAAWSHGTHRRVSRGRDLVRHAQRYRRSRQTRRRLLAAPRAATACISSILSVRWSGGWLLRRLVRLPRAAGARPGAATRSSCWGRVAVKKSRSRPCGCKQAQQPRPERVWMALESIAARGEPRLVTWAPAPPRHVLRHSRDWSRLPPRLHRE